MQGIEDALIDIIDKYGYESGKYNNLRVKNSKEDLTAIFVKLWDLPCTSMTTGEHSHAVTYEFEDGSRIFIGNLGELSWDFNFTPTNQILAGRVEGRVDPEQKIALAKKRQKKVEKYQKKVE